MSVAHIASIQKREDGRYIVAFPDVPEAKAEGATFEEALANGRASVACALEGRMRDGRAPFRRSDIMRLRQEIVDPGAIPVAIGVEVATPMVRIRISIERPLLERVDRAASAAGLSRSGFFVRAARAALKKKQRTSARA